MTYIKKLIEKLQIGLKKGGSVNDSSYIQGLTLIIISIRFVHVQQIVAFVAKQLEGTKTSKSTKQE